MPTEKEKREVLASVSMGVVEVGEMWSAYERLVGVESEEYWERYYEDVEVGRWGGAAGRICRLIRYSAPTEISVGPSQTRVVELQEIRHRDGGGFVLWRAVMALDALLGERFAVHMATEVVRRPGGGWEVRYRLLPVFRRFMCGMQAVVRREILRRYAKSVKHMTRWLRDE